VAITTGPHVVARLTPQNIAFLDFFRADPTHHQSSNYMKAYPRCNKIKAAEANASAILAKPEAIKYLEKKAAKANAAVDLKEEDILRDLIELTDKCMGREAVAIVKITKDGDVVTSDEKVFNALGAKGALELLGRNKKMFTDKLAHEGMVTNVEYNFDFTGKSKKKSAEAG